MKLIPFFEFPVRVRYFPGESLLGYIYRHMSANGHVMRGNGYYRIAKIMLASKSVTQFDKSFEILRQVINNDNLMDPLFWRDYKYLNFGISEKLMRFRAHTVWYCPHCLCDNEYHLSCWQVLGVHSCPYHGVLLSSTCPECGKTLAWISLLPNWSCSCGCRLTDRAINVRKVYWTIQERDPSQYLTPHLRPSSKYVDNFHTFTLDQTQVINLVVAKDVGEDMQYDDIKSTPKVGTRLASQFVRYLYFWQRKDLGYQRTQNIDLTFLMRPHKFPSDERERTDQDRSTPFCIYQREHFSTNFLESIPDSACAALVDHFTVWWIRNCHKLKHLEVPEVEDWDCFPVPSKDQRLEYREDQIFELLENFLIIVILGYEIDDLDLCKSHWIIPEAITLPSSISPHIRLIDYFMSCTEERLEKWIRCLREDLKRLESKFEFTHLGFLNES